MNFTIESDKLWADIDLSFEQQEGLREMIKEHICYDKEFMANIKEYCEGEYKEYLENLDPNEKPRLTLENGFIDLKIDELVEKALGRIKFYVEFDVEISEADF
jgi:hypothetical protein